MPKKKQTYSVKLPVVGYAFVDVEAASAQDALDAALEQVTIDNMEEWEGHAIVCEGNLYHGNCNEASVFDEDGEECEVSTRTKLR